MDLYALKRITLAASLFVGLTAPCATMAQTQYNDPMTPDNLRAYSPTFARMTDEQLAQIIQAYKQGQIPSPNIVAQTSSSSTSSSTTSTTMPAQ